MSDLCSGQLKLYSNIPETEVDWLWYPYIPFGKLTVLNGDPGNGKSTLMMNIIAAASSGGFVPDGRKMKKPIHVIYQCSEDSAGDTIKPRLIAAGADCSNVGFIDEELTTLSLNDEVIRRAIADFNAKLLVIDPVQAYLGEADISNVGGMRRILHQLSLWAARYDCAVVLIGHLNKRQSSKDIYRSLGTVLECGALVQGMGIGVGHRLTGGIVDRYKIRVSGCDVGNAACKLGSIGGGIFKRNCRACNVGCINPAECFGILNFGVTYGIRHVYELLDCYLMCMRSHRQRGTKRQKKHRSR